MPPECSCALCRICDLFEFYDRLARRYPPVKCEQFYRERLMNNALGRVKRQQDEPLKRRVA